MKIGVVADTHSQEVPKQLWDDFEDMDCIVHAGDFCTWDDYQKFKDKKELKAVLGNLDDAKLKKVLPQKLIFKLGGFSFGVYHGEGPAQKVLDFAKAKFEKDKVDAVIFGHSHIPLNLTIGGVLYFNPGSPCDTICAPYCSYGVIEIENRTISGKIIKVK